MPLFTWSLKKFGNNQNREKIEPPWEMKTKTSISVSVFGPRWFSHKTLSSFFFVSLLPHQDTQRLGLIFMTLWRTKSFITRTRGHRERERCLRKEEWRNRQKNSSILIQIPVVWRRCQVVSLINFFFLHILQVFFFEIPTMRNSVDFLFAGT